MLDTNSCIQFLNGSSLQVAAHFRAHAPAHLKLCSVVKAELLCGAAGSARPDRNLAFMERFFADYESLPFDDLAVSSYARIRRDLAVAGTPIGPNDLLIAAIALSRKMILVTTIRANSVVFQDSPLRIGKRRRDWDGILKQSLPTIGKPRPNMLAVSTIASPAFSSHNNLALIPQQLSYPAQFRHAIS